MAYIVADRVKETTTSTGTGAITLAGAVTGFKTFLSTVGNSNSTTYVIVNSTGSEWEVGVGTLSGGTTLTRTRVFSNSLGTTAAVSFTAGTKTVFVSMSAAPYNNNTIYGNSLNFNPSTSQFITAIGYGATVVGNYGSAVGQYSTASGDNAIAFGGGASATGNGTTAIGQSANANTGYSTAVGSSATASNSYAVALGNSAAASGYQSIAIGNSVTANASKAISIGYNTSAGLNTDTTVIGDNITASTNGATYMNRFRTSVIPVGTAYALTWDSTTKEVYAAPGGGGGGGVTSIIAGTGVTITSTGPGGTGDVTINASGAPTGLNWVGYQDNGFSMLPLDLAVPSGAPTTSNPNSTYFFTPGGASPTGGWSYAGFGGGGVGSVYYTSSYPLTSPLSGFNFNGPAVVYVAAYTTDAGTSFTQPVATGSGGYSNFSGSLYMYSGFPVMGGTRYGHYIAVVQGSYVGSLVTNPGCTLMDEFFDAYYGYTYYFIDVDSSAVSNLSSGMPVGALGSSVTYTSFFWYNYS